MYIMDVRGIGLESMNWILVTEDRDWWQSLLNTVMNLLVP
jgi:hypothetical protein